MPLIRLTEELLREAEALLADKPKLRKRTKRGHSMTDADTIANAELLIWQTESHGKTIEQAANEFARNNWSNPRKVKSISPTGEFSVVHGWNTYRIKLDSTKRPAVY